VAEGWICPRCQSAWAPHVDECRRCAGGTTAVATAAPVVQPPAPAAPPTTFRELWNEWEPTRATKPDAQIVAVARVVLTRTRIEVDGQQVAVIDLPATQLTPYTVELAKAKLELSKTRLGKAPRPSYIQRVFTVAQTCLAWHVEISKKLATNPMSGWRRYPDETRRQWKPTWAETEAICKLGHPMFSDITRTQFRCVGFRPGEARLLKKNEVFIAERRIHLGRLRTKNKKTAPIPIPEDIVEILERRMRESRGDYVFVAVNDPTRTQPVPESTYQSWYRKARERAEAAGITGPAGERWVPYHARHGGINQPISDGADAVLVGELARVSPAVMRRHYLGVTAAQQDSVRSVLNKRSVTPIVQAGERKGPIGLVRQPDSDGVVKGASE